MPQLGDLLARVALGETLGRGEAETLRLEFNNLQSIGAIARKWAAPNGELDLSFLPISTVYSKRLVQATTAVTIPIPTAYNHLFIMASGRSDVVDTVAGIGLRFNGDSGANYDAQTVFARSATISTNTRQNDTSGLIGYFPGTTTTAGHPGGIVAFVPNIHSGIRKTYMGLNYHWSDAAGWETTLQLEGGEWTDTATIKTLTIMDTGLTMSIGTAIAVIGIV